MARTRTTDQVSAVALTARGTSWREREQHVPFSR